MINGFKVLTNEYDFYRFKDDEKERLINNIIIVPYGNDSCIYFPISLDAMCQRINYNEKFGMIVLIKHECHPSTYKRWIKIGSFSPDDLDIDLEFDEPDENLFQVLFTRLCYINKINTSYHQILEELHKEFGGKLYT